MFSAQVCGHVCLDLIPTLSSAPSTLPGALHDVGPLQARPGGCVANTGGDLHALGSRVTTVSRIGSDEAGHILARLLTARDSAVHTLLTEHQAGTSYSIVVQSPGSDRTFWHHPGANNSFAVSDVNPRASDLLHLGYPPLLAGLTADGAVGWLDLFSEARAAGVTTSLDLAVVDSRSAAATVDWPSVLARVLPLCDVISPSRDDLISALGWAIPASQRGLVDAARALLDRGVAVAMVSGGTVGLALAVAERHRLAKSRVMLANAAEWAGQTWWMPAPPVSATGTTGAGDAASAGLLYGLLTGRGPARSLMTAAAAAAHRVGDAERLPPYGDGTAYLTATGPFRMPD
ncbi:sugar/nucleoside kinase (ribokinase family) [Nonomuraea polychroma]|uniref:Sugar/nucleoside kinase (Ribokinase family) n=1 Tax=Nonomuraea polychroma TaxID=46176 RepID=A0A438MDP4_9ACTN|nr:PfkB family carbohydrate kinase [Nonomuraea polychroma]RVX43913.1 sugar/nucleoside kinase (ribokinase family) [Nonomuraea polychroma]